MRVVRPVLVTILAAAVAGGAVLPAGHLHEPGEEGAPFVHAHWDLHDAPGAHPLLSADDHHDDVALTLAFVAVAGPATSAPLPPAEPGSAVPGLPARARVAFVLDDDVRPGPSPPASATVPRAPPA